jgi:hypothetical protein
VIASSAAPSSAKESQTNPTMMQDVVGPGSSLDTLDDTARSFYLHHEFVPLLDRPNRLFLAMATIEKVSQPR